MGAVRLLAFCIASPNNSSLAESDSGFGFGLGARVCPIEGFVTRVICHAIPPRSLFGRVACGRGGVGRRGEGALMVRVSRVLILLSFLWSRQAHSSKHRQKGRHPTPPLYTLTVSAIRTLSTQRMLTSFLPPQCRIVSTNRRPARAGCRPGLFSPFWYDQSTWTHAFVNGAAPQRLGRPIYH